MRRRIALRDLVASGPVLSARARAALLQGAPSGVAYQTAPGGPHPVLPLQVFGVAYTRDVVLVTEHPDWDMTELACVRAPHGPLWLCKDSRAGTLEQTIVADHPDVATWFPEVPLRRFHHPVEVDDRSRGGTFELALAYTNPDGARVEVEARGPAPSGPLRSRNSSTIGHSRDQVLAALDLSHRAFLRHATVRVDGQVQRIRRILGVQPFQLVMRQAQAGLSVGAWRQRSVDGAVHTWHGPVEQRWTVEPSEGGVALVQRHPLRTVRYAFARHGDALELRRASVGPCDLHLHPHLPDARRRFDGVFEGRWVLDVNGQPAHAAGTIRASWSDDQLTLALRGTAPRWVTDRPLDAVIRPHDEGWDVAVARVQA